MTPLGRFQKWYLDQCDGDWEHIFSIKIETLDNPGWAVDITVKETKLESKLFSPIRIEKTDNDWIHAVIKDGVFLINCGPQNLEDALAIFCDWTES